MAADQFDSTAQNTTMSPPIEPEALGSGTPPPAWHKPIGVIAIVFGSLGMLGGCSGLFYPKLMEMMASNVPREMEEQFKVAEDFAGWTIASSLAGLVAAAALLAAGIGVLKQRRWGITTARVWAVAKMVVVAATSVLTYQILQESTAAMLRTQGTQAMPPGFMSAVGAMSIGMGIMWGWALPVFLLIWFGRRKIRQDVAAWG
ncbi:MAG: hypothetical protein IID37_07460 [Planctomycetes bacterium]|nr:hypothetical protein [Planctomycetota bacterium]